MILFPRKFRGILNIQPRQEMKFLIDLEGNKSDADDWGGTSSQLFMKISLQARSPKLAKKKAREIFRKVHPNSRSRIHSTTCVITKMSLTPKGKSLTQKTQIARVQKAEHWKNGVLMGMTDRQSPTTIQSPKLRWESVPRRQFIGAN